jgi:signal peptidase
VTLTAPPKTGYYRRFVVEHRYLAVLPTDTIRTLHTVHPWLPVVVIDALVGVPFYLLGVALVGTGRVRRRTRDVDWTSRLRGRIRRYLLPRR